MAEPRPDALHIRDLLLRCTIGVSDEERREKQDVLINITLYADLSAACASDRIADSVDYAAIKKQIIALVEGSSCLLVERLAQRIADRCLEHPRVERVRVSVEKPTALRFARTVGAEIVRGRGGMD